MPPSEPPTPGPADVSKSGAVPAADAIVAPAAADRAAAGTPVGAKRLESAYHATALFVLVVLVLYWGHVVVVPLALAALFAFILSTPAEWLEKRGLGRVGGVLLVTAGAFGLLALVVTVATGQIKGLATDLPQYQENIQRKIGPIVSLMDRLEKIQRNVEAAGGGGAATRPATQPAAGESAAAGTAAAGTATGGAAVPVVVKPPGSSALSWLPSVALPLVESLVNAFLVIVLSVFMLMQRETFRDRIIRLVGRGRLSGTTRALGDAAARVGKYLLLQLGINACLGLAVTLGLWLLGVPYAPLFGLLVTVLRFVPYVGYWIAGLAAIAMSAAVSEGWGHPLMVLGMFLAFDLVLANVVEPLIFSHGTGVSPVALLIAAVFWAFLWGPVGLLLSTPLTVCLVVLGKHVPALGFLNVLLGDEPSLDMAARYYNRLLARDYDEAAVILDNYGKEHPAAAIYDEVILPALAQVKTDREQRDVSVEEERAVYEATRALLDGVEGDDSDAAAAAAGGAVPVRVIGCAVFGEADELGLRMLGDAIRPAGGEVEVVRPAELLPAVARAVEAAAEDRPPVVCLSTLSPGGLSQARALISRVRRRFPKVRMLVGRWGQTGDTSQTEKYLKSSGADQVGWTLRETIGQLVPTRAEAPRQPAAT